MPNTRLGGKVVQIPFGSTIQPDLSFGDSITGSMHVVDVLTGNVTIAAPIGHPMPGQELMLSFTQDGSGSRTITWNSIYKVNFTASTVAGRRDIVVLQYDGTNWVQTSSTINIS